jgi:hypothetical protein
MKNGGFVAHGDFGQLRGCPPAKFPLALRGGLAQQLES